MMRRSVCTFVPILVLFLLSESELMGFSLPIPKIPHLDTATTAVKETSKADRPVSDEEEYYIGRAVAARILASSPLLENKALTDYVNLIGQTVALNSDAPYTYGGYHFAVLNTDEVNAFACPGGTILITKGMIYATRNEEELAAVLAHEIAHISHRDGIAAIKSARWTEALTVIGAQAAGRYTPAQLSQLTALFEGAVEDVFKTLVVSGYGRSQEYSADETAMGYLARAGYDPSSLKDFLTRLINQGSASQGGIVKTHPGTGDRLKSIAQKVPPQKPVISFVQARTARYSSALSGASVRPIN